MKRFITTLVLTTMLAPWPTVRAYDLNGSYWPGDTANFNVNFTFGDNGYSANDFELAFIEGLEAWNGKSNFTFTWVKNSAVNPCNSEEAPDFKNGTSFGSTFCGASWGSSTLAVTRLWIDNFSRAVDTDIVFNANKSWGLHGGGTSNPFDFRRVAAHEAGHALGLAHTGTFPSIMWPSYTAVTSPQADDINGLQAIYGGQSRALDVAVNGGGSVSSDPPGIDCGATCSDEFSLNSTVSLSPMPDPGWEFSSWSGDCGGTGSCSVFMGGDRSVTATFIQSFHTLTVNKSGNGSVTSTPAGISCAGGCSQDSASFLHNTIVTLTASPASGRTFAGWGGACSGTGACGLTMTADRTVNAVFFADLDGDGIPDAQDTDRDGDGFSNADEQAFGSDPDVFDFDRNNNGIPDKIDAARALPGVLLPLLGSG